MRHPHNYKTVYITEDSKAFYSCITILDHFKKTKNYFGLDIETTFKKGFEGTEKAGLDPYLSRIRLIQIASEDLGKVYVFDLFHLTRTKSIIKVLTTCRFFAHNAFFEQKQLLRFTKGKQMLIYCTQIMYLIHVRSKRPNPSAYRATLEAAVKQLLNITVDKDHQTSDWSRKKLLRSQIEYATLDATYCYTIGVALAKRLMKESPKSLKINMQAIAPLAGMMNTGVFMDAAEYKTFIPLWEKESVKNLRKCYEELGPVNFKSPKQLSAWIEENVPKDVLEMWPRTKSGKTYCTGQDILLEFSVVPGLEYLCEYKKHEKLLSTYGNSLIARINPITDRLHCSYTLGYTTTDRLSAREPNLQNLPRAKKGEAQPVRGAFKAQRDHTTLICADYSQIELRCAAYISNDQAMLREYSQGADLHRRTGAMMAGKELKDVTKEERQRAKAVNFGLLFGMGAKKLKLYAKVNYKVDMTEQQAYKAVETFRKTYPEYREWQLRVSDEAKQSLKTTNISGMIRRLTEKNYFCCAMNTPVQGGAADVMKRAIIRIDRKLRKEKLKAKLILTVHDEVVVETFIRISKKVKKLVEFQMTKAYHDIFPGAPSKDLVEACIGKTWIEAKG